MYYLKLAGIVLLYGVIALAGIGWEIEREADIDSHGVMDWHLPSSASH